MTTTMTNRFSPAADEPYGSCKNCDALFATREEMSAHLSETFEQGGRVNGNGHTARVTNSTRAERIRSHVQFAIESAIYDFMEEMERDIDRGHLTAEEVREALGGHPDFGDAWEEREDES